MHLLIPALIGLVAGLLGGLLGVGGSVIIIPGLILYLDLTTSGYTGSHQHLLQAAAMICNVFVAAPSVVAHYRAGMIMRSVVAFLVPGALAGILLGVHTSNMSWFARENGAYLGMCFAAFMVYVAGYNVWRLVAGTDLQRRFDARQKPSAPAAGAVGLVMGFAAGLLGIGGGALCVPMQQIALRIPLRRAIANSAVTIVCVSSIGAAFKNLTLTAHHIPVAASVRLALLLIPTAILGSYLGGSLTHALPRKVLRLVFIAFMASMAYLTFTKAWQASPLGAGRRQSPPAAAAQSPNSLTQRHTLRPGNLTQRRKALHAFLHQRHGLASSVARPKPWHASHFAQPATQQAFSFAPWRLGERFLRSRPCKPGCFAPAVVAAILTACVQAWRGVDLR